MQAADTVPCLRSTPAFIDDVVPLHDHPEMAWLQLGLKPKTERVLRELLRSLREGRAVSALWSSESSQAAVQIACLLARDVGSRVLHVQLQQAAAPGFRELEIQLDRLFELTEDQRSILVLDRMDTLLCSRDEFRRQRFESYLLKRLARHQGAAIVVMPQHKRINPRLVRRLHFALAV